MSPTVFREGAYRFFFFSREEARLHVHVSHPSGEAQRLATALRLIEEHEGEIHTAWRRHFPG